MKKCLELTSEIKEKGKRTQSYLDLWLYDREYIRFQYFNTIIIIKRPPYPDLDSHRSKIISSKTGFELVGQFSGS